jgi:hypothetical protein
MVVMIVMGAYCVDQLVDTESIASRIVERALRNAIRQCPTLRTIGLAWTRVRPLAATDVNHPLSLQFAVCLAYRVRIDSQLDREVAH